MVIPEHLQEHGRVTGQAGRGERMGQARPSQEGPRV